MFASLLIAKLLIIQELILTGNGCQYHFIQGTNIYFIINTDNYLKICMHMKLE